MRAGPTRLLPGAGWSRFDIPVEDMYGETSGGQVTFKKSLSYFISVTCKSNSLLLIRYPFFIVTVPLHLPVTDILNVTVLDHLEQFTASS